jgi:FkbH-like protein
MSLRGFLDYPFDVQNILRKRRALRSELVQQQGLTDIRVAILGGSTTQEIRSVLELFLLHNGFRAEFFESEYGKFFEDAVVDDSALRDFRPQVAIVHTTQLNLLNAPAPFTPADEVEQSFKAECARFQSIWRNLTQSLGCVVIQNNFDMPATRSLGGLDSTELFGRTHFLLRLNLEFARAARENSKLIINDIHYLSCRLGLDQWFDPVCWFSYKMAVSPASTVFLAHALARLVSAALGRTRKCLVLDLDNTLWGGVIGDDGATGIKIGKETPQGEAFTSFQQYCRELAQRGILLAACSKNEPESARAGLSHPDSVLTVESFSAIQANWDPKPGNVARIARDLNIGLDSLVFVDDNPAERAFVRAQLPDVAVPEVGSEVSKFARYLDRAGFFEVVALNRDDAQRGAMYAENAKRTALQSQFADYQEFLESLSMQAEIGEFSPVYLERICQLTNKTNQFNLTTKRYTLAEMEAMAASPECVTLYGRLKDKFGDNGLVSVLAARLKGRELHIELWLMSCRVLKRDMEAAMLDALVSRAAERGATDIIGYYYRTAKNGMVAEHYRSLGFEPESLEQDGSRSTWRLAIGKYMPRNKSIKEIIHA